MTTIGISYAADLSVLRKELASIPGITKKEAQAAVAELGKVIREAEKAGKAATGKMKEAAAATDQMRAASAQTAGAASKLAGALNMVSPELGSIVNGGKAAADVMEVMSLTSGSRLAPALGAVGLAAAAAGLAYFALSGDVERANQTMQQSADIASQVQTASMDLERSRIDLAVATGQLTEAEGRQAKAQVELSAQISAVTTSTREQRTAIEQSTTKAEKWLEGLDKVTDVLLVVNPLLGAWTKLVAEGVDRVAGLSDKVAEGSQQLANLDRGLEANTTILEQNAAAQEETAKAAEEKAKQDKAAAAASAAAAKATAARAAAAKEAERAEVQAATKAADALARLEAQALATRTGMLSGADLVLEKLAQEVAAVDATAAAYAENGEIQAAAIEARKALEAEAAAEIAEIRAKQAETDAAAKEKARADSEAAAAAAKDEARAISEAYAQSAASLAGSTSEAFGKIAESLADKNRDAAMAVFRVSQAAAAAQTIINTAMSISSIWATWAAVPPVAAALTAAATAVGAVQLGTIMAQKPSFHTGGIIGSSGGNDEVQIGGATMLRGEGVLSRQGVATVGGEDEVRRANRGERRHDPIILQMRVGPAVVESMVYDGAGARGGTLRPLGRRGKGVGGRSYRA